MTVIEDKIDLDKLGFEITVRSLSGDEDDRGYDDDLQDGVFSQRPLAVTLKDEGHEFDIIFDDISGVSSDYSFDDLDDEENGRRPSPTPMPVRTFAQRTSSERRRSIKPGYDDLGYEAHLGYEDLGYEPATPPPDQFGYGETITRSKLGYGGDDQASTQILGLGRPGRNRRSMGRRHTGSVSMASSRAASARVTIHSSSTTSSTKLKRAHRSQRRPSQREKMVARTTQSRLSRQNHAQLSVRTISDEYGVSRTLRDLGCSEHLLESVRGRMPRKVSLEYGTDGEDSITAPKLVCLEFARNSTSLMPRRVSIGYDQRPEGQPRRRGSLDFSLGTSTLPRRDSMGRLKQKSFPPFGRRATASGSCTYATSTVRRGSLDFSVGTYHLPRRGSLDYCEPPQSHQRASSDALEAFRRRGSLTQSQLRRNLSPNRSPCTKVPSGITLRKARPRLSLQSFGSDRSSISEFLEAARAVRRVSLDVSIGTSQLPRRASVTCGPVAEHHRRYSLAGPTYSQPIAIPQTRRASCSLSPTSSSRYDLDVSKNSNSPGSRRASFAHIPRKHLHSMNGSFSSIQQQQPSSTRRYSLKQTSMVEVAMKHQSQAQSIGHQLSYSHVRSVQYLTRDTNGPAHNVGRSA